LLYSPSDGLTLATVAALAGATSSPAGIVIIGLDQLCGLRCGFLMSTKTGACPGLGQDVLFQPDIYGSHNIACVMAYIVDLTIIMHRLSEIEISEECVVSTLKDYARSGEIAQVHNDIRAFSSRIVSPRRRDKDHTFEEIVRLIEKHRVQVPRTYSRPL
jgi:hypothetical protein